MWSEGGNADSTGVTRECALTGTDLLVWTVGLDTADACGCDGGSATTLLVEAARERPVELAEGGPV
jgi:hypothetical protein